MEFAARHWKVSEEDVEFRNNQVRIRELILPFEELVQQAYFGQVSLSSTGFYRTPKIFYDREQARGRPFYYFAYGAACSGGDSRYPHRRIPHAAHRHPA